MVDIAQRMRAVAQQHASPGFDEVVKFLLEEAATLIELQRATIASWEASAAIVRGSVAHEAACSDSAVITPGEVSTPR